MHKPRPPKPPQIIYLDDQLVVIDKPSGMLAVPGRSDEPSAIDWLRAQPELAGTESPRVVHRLDQGASGVQLYARTLEAQRHLVAQFMEREVEKVYYALVSGHVVQDGEVDLPLAFSRRRNRVEVSQKRGKPSRTAYRVLQHVAGHTWLECRPHTGRMHQIRVHLAAIGHPLSVDPHYGGGQAIFLSHLKPNYHPNRREEERPLIDRLTLHAARLVFVHPRMALPMSIESPLPKDLRATLAQLSRLN